MRLSQGHLNLLSTCPRKFQHTFLDQLGSPSTPEQQEKQSWGTQFHLLMQQRELGLPVEPFMQEDAQLQRWYTGLVGTASEILTVNPSPENFRESEHCRTLHFQGYLLTVIYDLLIADENKAQIFDWKTYPKPQNRRHLEKNWQTRLYLYIMAETSGYLPEQISMNYWFVQSEPEAKSLQFSYNSGQHEKTRRDLTKLVNQLTNWLERYEAGEPFPQVLEGARECNFCQFAVRCDRSPESQPTATHENDIPDLATIQEIAI